MINIIDVQTVNFYNDPIDVAVDDNNRAYVSLSQITGYLGLNHETIIERFEKDPRVDLDFLNDEAIIPLNKLNGFLMLLPVAEVPTDLRDDLMRYQVECFDALHDYWIHGVSINRREVPYDVTSKFKDERVVSRAALTKACADYYADVEGASELGLQQDLFDKCMGRAYDIIGLKPQHENEKLKGTEAQYLAWVESCIARTITKFIKWNERPEDPVAEAMVHVESHLRKTGNAWLAMADNVPASLYH